jgi:chromosome segregation ATPase
LDELEEANDKLREESHAHQTQLREAQDELVSVKAEKAELQEAHDKLQQAAKDCRKEPDNTRNNPTAANAGQAEMPEANEGLEQTELNDAHLEAEHIHNVRAMQGEPDALKEDVQRLRNELTTANNDLSSARDQEQSLRDRLRAVQDENEAAFDRERDLKWCRAKILRFMIVALRIGPDAVFIDDMTYDPSDQIVDRTLSQLEVCGFVFGRMESLVEEIFDAHKTTSEYLRKAERAMRVLRANLAESGTAIQLLRDEKEGLVRRANRLQQTNVRMDDQIKRLKGQVTQSIETCSVLLKSRDSLASKLDAARRVLL